MTGFDLFLLIVLCIFSIGILIVFLGSISQLKLKSSSTSKPFTLLIPAKDEADNIKRCLDAIKTQDYDLHQVEILFLDDDSRDDTKSIVESMKNDFKDLNIIDVDQDRDLVGKANAIDQGIKIAKNDIILICDADCAPNPQWFSMIISQFSEDVGVVSGITLLKETLISNRLFGILQNIDWVFLLGTGSGAVGAGFPISCIGSNLAFRKKAYNEVGGYEKIPFSITEDLALYKMISRKTKWAFRFPLNKESINWSIPMPTFKSFYRQRKRWLFGSFDLNFFGGVLLAAAVLIHSIPIFSLFLGEQPFWANLSLIIVFTIDFMIIAHFLIALRQWKYIVFIPVYFLYYLFNIVLLPFVLLFDHKVIWKNRSYTKKGFTHRI